MDTSTSVGKSRGSQRFHGRAKVVAFALFGVSALTLSGGTEPANAQSPACVRELTADVVALDQAVQFNRYGAHHPGYMIYALREDVVAKDGGTSLSAGRVKLREDKRPRPLVLRANVGDCLTINFQNLLGSSPLSVPGVSVDQPATRAAGLHVAGLDYVGGISADGANVGLNASSLALPGGQKTYKLHATREGVFGFYNSAVQTGGESNIGSSAFGMFGAIAVQPAGAEWYRSQVSREELDLATRRDPANGNALKTLTTGHPDIDYNAVYPSGHK
ncbi:MAG TPA: hypothetical protein VIL69_05850, partial [Roseomonas sp.]